MMTDEQQMRLIGEIVDQVRAGELSAEHGAIAVALVLSPRDVTYEQAAIEVRCKVAHLGD